MVKTLLILISLLVTNSVSADGLIQFYHDTRLNPSVPHQMQIVYIKPDFSPNSTIDYEHNLTLLTQKIQPFISEEWYPSFVSEIKAEWNYSGNGGHEYQSKLELPLTPYQTVSTIVYRLHFSFNWKDPGMIAILLSCNDPQDVVFFYSIFQRYLIVHELTHSSQRKKENLDDFTYQHDESEADVQAYHELIKLTKTEYAKQRVRLWFKNLALARNVSMVYLGDIDHWSYRPLNLALRHQIPQQQAPKFPSQHYSDILDKFNIKFDSSKFPEELPRFQHQWNQAIPRAEQDWLPSGEEAVLGLITFDQYQSKLKRWEQKLGSDWWIPYLQSAPIIESSPFEIPPIE